MRLIDADALRDEMFVDWFDSDDLGFISHRIDDAPTIDAVQVVRCKDCKHIVRNDGVCKVLSNNYEPPVYVDDDDFCSHGERRSE